jgi:endonuclease YncB( thermonuclease family)
MRLRAVGSIPFLVATILTLLLLGAFACGARPIVSADAPDPPPADQIRATVLAIGDGDTLRVSQGENTITVRLACIDAPELDQPSDGTASRTYLRSRLRRGSQVRLIPHATDRHGRLVAEVISDTNLNLALVEDGQAFVYPRHVHQCDEAAFRAAEGRASRAGLGIWRVRGGIFRPWDHRQRQRRLNAHPAASASAAAPSPRSHP